MVLPMIGWLQTYSTQSADMNETDIDMKKPCLFVSLILVFCLVCFVFVVVGFFFFFFLQCH